MRRLAPGLQVYLWAIYGAGVMLLVAQLAPVLGHAGQRRVTVSALVAAGLLLLLAYGGERLQLQVSRSASRNLAPVVYLAMILLVRPPVPVLVACGASLLSQLIHERIPPYKRLFNICHTTLTVGLCSAFLALASTPARVLRPEHIVAASPLLAALVLLYYVLDVGPVVIVLALAERQAPWHVWWRVCRPTLLFEMVASTSGILVATVWLYNPVLLALLALPVVALRRAYEAIIQADERALALRRRGAQLEAVLAAGQGLRLQHSRASLLQIVAEAALAVTNAASVAGYLPDPEDTGMLERVVLVQAPRGSRDESAHGAPALGGEGDAGLTQGPRRIARAVAQARTAPGGVLLTPLEIDGAAIAGLLWLAGVPAHLCHDDGDALAILATQAAIALQNAQLHERALAQASEDGLTGLLNHRAFQTRLEEEVARAQRSGQPLALLMIDLDDFREVNNRHGHQIGDAALLHVASILRATVRTSDVVARYGGDEFAVILLDTALDDALTMAARLYEAVTALRFLEGGVTLRVEMSIGVAALPVHATTREDLVRAADGAAYAAKHAGKGRIGRPEDALLILDQDAAVLASRLEHANVATVQALAAAVDAKDPYTRGHSQRVSAYAVAIATALGLGPTDVARVRLAGLLHDVGKIGVPDAILTKAGRLTEEEFATVQQHPIVGERMLASVPYLQEILPAVRSHHERWDGHGYPDRIAGDALPPDAAILAVADAFDAMTSSRTYRMALPFDEAYRRVHEGSGTQFAPHIVVAFERAVADGSLVLLAAESEHLPAMAS